MISSVHDTVSNSKHNGTYFYADIHTGRRLHILMSMNENPFASQHRPGRMGSHLFVRKLDDGLKESCDTTWLDLAFKLLEFNLRHK